MDGLTAAAVQVPGARARSVSCPACGWHSPAGTTECDCGHCLAPGTALARAFATARWPLYAAAAVAALAGGTGVVVAESDAHTRAATGEALMIALAVCNALMFTALLRVFHHQYRWRGVDWDLYALIALQVVLAIVVLLGLTDATMRGPAAPVYGLVMLGWSLFSIDIGLGLLSSFPKALGLWRWYAYLQLGSGVGIASMALLPLAGYLGVAADFVLAVVFFRAARGGG